MENIVRKGEFACNNIVRKGEIACYKQFLLFSQCFPTYMALIFYYSYPIWHLFLAHLRTTCSRGAFRVVRCPSSTISLNIFSQTAGPIWTKLGRNGPWEVLFKTCSQNLIPSKTLVAIATKLNFLSDSLKSSPLEPLVRF